MKHKIVLFFFIILAGTITLSADVTVYLDPAYGTGGKEIQLTIENLNDPHFPKPKHHQPVLFVPDFRFGGKKDFRSFRETLALPQNARLGIEPYYIDLEDHKYADNAAKIKEAMELILLHQDDPGANRKKVAVVAFGSGAVSARLYLKKLWENQNKRLSFHPVSELIAISPPNHGMEGMGAKSLDFFEQLNGHPIDDTTPGNYRGQLFDSEAPGSRRNNEPVKNGILYVTLYAEGNRAVTGGGEPSPDGIMAKNLSPNAENREIAGITGIPGGNDKTAVHQNTVHMPEVICKALYTAAYHQAPPDQLPFKNAGDNNLKSPPIVPELQIPKLETGIVLLFDISGSMSQFLLPAKGAAEHFIYGLNDYRKTGGNLGIAVFPPLPWNVREECGAQNITPMAVLTDKNKNNAVKILDCLTAKGSTPLLEGINAAQQLFSAEKRKIIILFSDGNHNCPVPVEANPPDTAIDALIDKLEKNRVTLYTIGSGPPLQVNHTLLRKLAEDRKENQKGKFFHLIDPKTTLKETYTSIFTDIFPDPGLNVQTGFDRSEYETGETITFTAAITKGKLPVNGLKAITASVTRPLEGAGNWYASNNLNAKELESVPGKIGDETLSELQRKTVYLSQKRKTPPPGRTAPAVLQLYDDGTHGDKKSGDGIYTGLYKDTQKEGTYNFRVHAAGDTFEREKTVQTHVMVKPDHGYSVPVTRWLNIFPGDPVQYLYEVEIIPRDRYGNHMGPGHRVGVNVVDDNNNNKTRTQLKDNLDGTYTGKFNITQSEFNAGVFFEFTIDGKPFTTVKKIPGFKKWFSGIHVGTGIPIRSFDEDYNPGIGFGGNIGYRLAPKFSLVLLLGHNSFTADAPDNDDIYFWNISANLRSEIVKNPLRVFVNAGAGIYFPNSGPAKRGVNVGAGAAYALKADWIIEAGADFHLVNSVGTDPNFMVTYARLVYRF